MTQKYNMWLNGLYIGVMFTNLLHLAFNFTREALIANTFLNAFILCLFIYFLGGNHDNNT